MGALDRQRSLGLVSALHPEGIGMPRSFRLRTIGVPLLVLIAGTALPPASRAAASDLAASPVAASRSGFPTSGDGGRAGLDRIAGLLLGEEIASGGAYAKLAWLTDRIGPRLTGSAGAE